MWDRSRLDQAITNLLSNAMKFGAREPIEVFVGERDGQAVLRVRDHGIGVAPEAQSRIFDRFERAVSADHYPGLGLGLYVTSRIVEAHNGRITVESRPGEGTTFTVLLPTRDVGTSAGVKGTS
jgi:signal transduction histidine kinase